MSSKQQSVELLQQLGLKEYEAKCFVALARRPQGTAKDISETSEVPRTRVYDAIRELESKGLVEIQHSSPKLFRTVSIDEAVETLRTEYEGRIEALRQALDDLDPSDADDEMGVTYEVWSLSGTAGITSRVQELIDDADQEVVLIVGDGSVFSDHLAERLRSASDRGVDVLVGTPEATALERITTALPGARTFVSGLEWLSHSELCGDDTEISRLLLVDNEAILVSSFTDSSADGRDHEQAVFGRGFDNGIVAVSRRLMATGLPDRYND
jgi:sugar-specific transcriptional regulator TrmB